MTVKKDESEPNSSGTAYQPLDEAPADTAGIPAATATPMVEVVAPSTLAEGYTFEATAPSGETFTAVVPSGGVTEGQKFLTAMATTATEGGMSPALAYEIPTGRWKDGLCDCCRLGCCHPMLCLAIWCEPIALAQVMTRMRLTWCGQEGRLGEKPRTFRNVLFVFFGYIVLDAFFQTLYAAYAPNEGDPDYDENNPSANLPSVCIVAYVLDLILEACFGLYLLYLLIVTRTYIRNKYSIPEQRCIGCEDVCCSFWCGLCTLTQIARHTADYDTYAAACCTETGLPSHVDAIV